MQVLPAIDIKNGRCVRLSQGEASRETVYAEDPVAVARGFEKAGARMLHLVDLDGAFEGRRINGAVIQSLRRAISIPIELGGGIRALADIEELLNLGVDSVVVGTMAVRAADSLQQALETFGPDRVQLGIDARDGKVAVAGWTDGTALEALEFARHWEGLGIQRIIYTDISRDGMMAGPNLAAVKAFAQAGNTKITASGGVSSEADLNALKKLAPLGVDRIIVGKALYEGALSLETLAAGGWL